jgi:glycogen operon protein
MYLDGADDPDRAADGTPLIDDDFLVLINGWWEQLDFAVPATRSHQEWWPEIDTFDTAATGTPAALRAGDRLSVGPRSVLVLRGPR